MEVAWLAAGLGDRDVPGQRGTLTIADERHR
jgi:hypothetical protein